MGDVRDKSSGLLNATLTDLSTQQSDAGAQASAVEQALFDKHQGDTGNAYRSDVRELSQNLKHNPDIGARVAEGEVPADELVNMTSEVSVAPLISFRCNVVLMLGVCSLSSTSN